MRTDIDRQKQQIEAWLLSGIPRFEIARRLKCKYDTLKSRIDKWGLSHLKNQSSKGQKKAKSRVHVSQHLIYGSTIHTYRLKQKLWRDSYKEKKCEQCGITEWQGQPVPLELDHINGDRWDNRLENLRILCPNCHALTPTNSGKNVGSY